MREKIALFLTGAFLFLLPKAEAQITITDTLVVVPQLVNNLKPAANILSADQIVFPPLVAKNPVTGKQDTLMPVKIEKKINLNSGSLSKTGNELPGIQSFSNTQYITYIVTYNFSLCNQQYQKVYTLPMVVVTYPPNYLVEFGARFMNFDHPLDRLYYHSISNTMIGFFLVKGLIKECEKVGECQSIEDPEEMIDMKICDELYTGIPDTCSEVMDADSLWHYEITWENYAGIDVDVSRTYYYDIEVRDRIETIYSTPITVVVRANDGTLLSGMPNRQFTLWGDEAAELWGTFQYINLGKNLTVDVPGIETTVYSTDFEQLSSGNLNYIVDEDIPGVDTEITFYIEDEYGLTAEKTTVIAGSDSIIFNLSIPEPKTVWPTLRERANEGNPNNRNILNSIALRVVRNNQPILNQEVTISINMILPSGGHDHVIQPQPALRGHLTAVGASTVEGEGEVTAQTNQEGIITVSYIAPAFGGRYELMASAQVDGEYIEDRDTLTVRVPNLVELPNENYYELIGETEEHASNHWATQAVMTCIQTIANNWHINNPNESTMMINDISLEYGGLLDVNGNWQPPHSSHRTGQDVDIRTELPGTRTGIPVRTPRNASIWQNTVWVGNTNFEDNCRTYGGIAHRHSPNSIYEHYHVDF